MDDSFSIHHRNIQSLAIEIYKFLPGPSPAIMGDGQQYKTRQASYIQPKKSPGTL